MKTISGLSSKYLRFDISNFVHQIRSTENISDITELSANTSSHPSIILRCRALLWFSIQYEDGHKKLSNQKLKKIDNNIKNDMDKFSDRAARKLISDAKEQVIFWGAVYKVIIDGSFTKKEQEKIKAKFGNEKLNSLLNLLNGLSVEDVKNEIYTRLNHSKADLQDLAPINFNDDIDEIEEIVNSFSIS